MTSLPSLGFPMIYDCVDVSIPIYRCAMLFDCQIPITDCR